MKNRGNEPMRDFIGSALADKVILDLGCGDCSFMDMFENIDKNKYFGLEKNKDLVKASQDKGYNVKVYDLESGNLPFEPSSFDIVVVKDILEHLDNFVDLLKDGRRVLCNTGILFVSVPSEWSRLLWADYTHKRAFNLDAIKQLLADTGFVFLEKENYQDLIKFKTSRLKYPMCYLFRILTGIDFITQGYLIKAEKR